MNQETDEELYSELLQGRRATAFRSLYDRHSGPLFRFINRFTLNTQSAEEILHDIFIQMLSGKFNLDADANLKSWLYTLAKNKSLNHCKKRSFESVNNLASDLVIEQAVSDNDLEANFIGENLLRKLTFLESSLPQDLMQTWALRKEGLDYYCKYQGPRW